MSRWETLLIALKAASLLLVCTIREGEIRTGRLLHVYEKAIVVREDPERKLYTHRVASGCDVSLDGLPATAADLSAGLSVTLTMTSFGPNAVNKIEAFSHPAHEASPVEE